VIDIDRPLLASAAILGIEALSLGKCRERLVQFPAYVCPVNSLSSANADHMVMGGVLPLVAA
jgi:hypothetical protein